jgi:hypothetical protein
MRTILMQFWEESEKGWGIRPDGASLHIDKQSHKRYIKEVYNDRDINNIPNEYERIVGEPIEVKVEEEIYNIVSSEKTLRLAQYQLSNLIKLKNIIVDVD